MKILFDCEKGAAFCRAARRMGHSAGERVGPWWDAVVGGRPDLVAVSEEVAASPEFAACLAAERFAHKVIGDIEPAADCPPDWAGGTRREALVSEVTVVGVCQPGHLPPLRKLVAAGVDLKVFGTGYEGLPQYLGELDDSEVADAYASAGAVFCPDGDLWRRRDVYAAGGVWLGNCLSQDYWSSADFVRWSVTLGRRMFGRMRGLTLSGHTFHNRLAHILSC